MHFELDESTYNLDCLLSSLGISSFHNVDIPNIPSRLEDLDRFRSIFYVFKAEQTTDKVEENLGIIYGNYPSSNIVNNQFSRETGRFERENKEEEKRILH